MFQIDDLGDEIGDLNDKLKDAKGDRESVQRQYNELVQSLLAAQEVLASNRASWERKEADSAKEIDKLKSDQILARQMAVTSEATIDTLRHQLNVAREEANRQALPAHSNALRYRGPVDSPQTPMDVTNGFRYRGPIDTPQALMDGSYVRGDTPHPPNYYHVGSAADLGYYDSMRNVMSGSDLLTGNMGESRVTDTGPSSSQNTLNHTTSSTLPLTPSVFRRQARLGRNYSLFKGSKVKVQGMYDLTLIGTNRSRCFGGTTAQYLQGSRFTAVQVHELVSHIQSLLRVDAYDESCLERLIDDIARSYLTISFTPLPVMRRNPTTNWMLDWDVAIFIEALEEAFPLNERDRHLSSDI